MTPKIAITAFAILAAAAFAASVSAAVPKAQWIAHCTGELSKELQQPRANRVYCACMHEMVGEAEDKYEYALERRWPPVHRHCYKKARFKPLP